MFKHVLGMATQYWDCRCKCGWHDLVPASEAPGACPRCGNPNLEYEPDDGS